MPREHLRPASPRRGSNAFAPRRWRIRGALGVVLVALLALTAAAVASEESTAAATAIDSRAAAETIISVQGVRFRDDVRGPSPSRLFAVDGDGDVQWSYSGTRHGFRWLYDVDPLSNGNLLVTATVPGDTVVFEFDPETRTRAWTERFDARDTHDVDLINGDELLVANLRNYDVEANVSRDRVFVYNRTRDEIVWEWQFRDHYPESTDNGFRVGWTHLNDVDEIDDGRFLASPRNFDQAIVINRSTRRSRCGSAETTTGRNCSSSTTPTTSSGRTGRRRCLWPTARTTASSSTRAPTASGSGPGPSAGSTGRATPTGCRTGTRSSRTRRTTGSSKSRRPVRSSGRSPRRGERTRPSAVATARTGRRSASRTRPAGTASTAGNSAESKPATRSGRGSRPPARGPRRSAGPRPRRRVPAIRGAVRAPVAVQLGVRGRGPRRSGGPHLGRGRTRLSVSSPASGRRGPLTRCSAAAVRQPRRL
ncbi:aryl-sulfate sulfotransferase [Halosimplex aquaticum]